jgi:hypothetical protein
MAVVFSRVCGHSIDRDYMPQVFQLALCKRTVTPFETNLVTSQNLTHFFGDVLHDELELGYR